MTSDRAASLEGFVEEIDRRRQLSISVEEVAKLGGLAPGELSLIKDTLDKDATIAAGSFCETFVSNVISGAFEHVERGLRYFVGRQAIERKFFQWFDFNGSNANGLFALFGPDLAVEFKNTVQAEELSDPIRAFLQLCRARNDLVHNNYVAADTTFTVADIHANVVSASRFLEWLASDFVKTIREFDSSRREAEG